MPSRNLEIVQRGFEAFNREGIEGIIPLIHPDFEATTPPDLASEPDTYRGPDGVRRWFESFDEVMDQIRWDSRGFRQVGDRVVVEFTLRARGKTTGLDFGQDAVMVWELRDGKAIRLVLYPTPSYILYRTLAELQDARTIEIPFAPDWTIDPSSFAIEGETPSPSRTERFVTALKAAPGFQPDKASLVRLQGDIVDRIVTIFGESLDAALEARAHGEIGGAGGGAMSSSTAG